MTPADLITVRAVEAGVPVSDVTGPRRYPRLNLLRKRIAHTLRAEPYKLSLPEIGRALGGRHHTTVLWMLRGGRPGGKGKPTERPGEST